MFTLQSVPTIRSTRCCFPALQNKLNDYKGLKFQFQYSAYRKMTKLRFTAKLWVLYSCPSSAMPYRLSISFQNCFRKCFNPQLISFNVFHLSYFPQWFIWKFDFSQKIGVRESILPLSLEPSSGSFENHGKHSESFSKSKRAQSSDTLSFGKIRRLFWRLSWYHQKFKRQLWRRKRNESCCCSCSFGIGKFCKYFCTMFIFILFIYFITYRWNSPIFRYSTWQCKVK